MNIYPKLNCKQFGKCEFGELILMESQSHKYWAFVVGEENDRITVLLSRFSGVSSMPSFYIPPCYTPPYDSARHVLSFGKNYQIKIDWDIDSFELKERLSPEYNGVLFIEGERHFLYVKYFDPRNVKTACIDLALGKSVESPRSPVAIFSKWSIEVNVGGDRFRTLVSFPLESEK